MTFILANLIDFLFFSLRKQKQETLDINYIIRMKEKEEQQRKNNFQ